MRTAFQARRVFLQAILLLVAASAVTAGFAAEYSPEVERRIAAVEVGLVPAVRIKGRTTPTTVAEQMSRDHVPGVSVAVINNYRIEWAKGYGVSDAGTGTPVTTETLFQAASMSKPMTALAALKLVEQGVLDLDRDVNQQLTSWHLPENEFTREHAVDLRGLLSHTAGLTVHGFPGYAVDEPRPTVPQILDGEKPANTPAVRVNKVPGHGFRYSGGGTTMVQLLMTDTTKRDFTDLVRDLVLAPLGMSASTFAQPLPREWEERATTAHDDQGRPIAGRWHIYPEQAPAGLWTTPSDMARYLIEVQQAHEGKSQKVLNHEMIDQMLTPQGGGPVGLGPFLVERGATRRFGHSGGNKGFRCDSVGFLDRGQGAVVMTNSDSGNRAMNEIMNSIAIAYDWPDYVPPEREEARLDPATRNSLVGDYALNVVALASVSQRDDRLFVKLPREAEMEIYPQADARFVAELPEVSGRWVADAAGRIEAIVFNLGDREVRAKRVP